MGLRNWARTQLIVQRSLDRMRVIRDRRRNPLGDVPTVPKRIIVEPTNACNLKCGFCGNANMLRKWSFLDVDLYRQLLDEMSELGIPRITLHTIGEPTMHPELPLLVKLARAHGLIVTLSTNGTRLTQEYCEALVDAAPHILSVSLDAATPETFERIREGIDAREVQAGLRRLRQVRDERGVPEESPWGNVPLPTLTATCVITRFFDREEERRWFETYGPLVDDTFFHWPNNHAGYSEEPMFQDHGVLPQRFRRWMYSKLRTACHYPWDGMFLLSDGTMSVCRFDFDARVTVGRYGDMNIMELWNSEAMNALRRAHLNFDFRDHSTCENCTGTYYENRHEHYVRSQRLKERNGYTAERNAWLAPDPMVERAKRGSGTMADVIGVG